jgi:hypothetical protein
VVGHPEDDPVSAVADSEDGVIVLLWLARRVFAFQKTIEAGKTVARLANVAEWVQDDDGKQWTWDYRVAPIREWRTIDVGETSKKWAKPTDANRDPDFEVLWEALGELTITPEVREEARHIAYQRLLDDVRETARKGSEGKPVT